MRTHIGHVEMKGRSSNPDSWADIDGQVSK